MHAGLFVVPVNWHWVARELAYVVDNSDAVALIADDRFLDVAAEARARAGASRAAGCASRISDAPPAGFTAYEAFARVGRRGRARRPAGRRPDVLHLGHHGLPEGRAQRRSSRPAPIRPLLGALSQMFLALLGVPAEGVSLLCGPAYHSAQWAFSMLPLVGGQHRRDAPQVRPRGDARS